MFSREVTNDYGSYSRVNDSTILFKGVFDKNFRELKTIDPNKATYKVFNCPSQSINFAVKLGSSTYVPQHLFDRLVTAYKENNPYYTINDLVTLEMDLSKTLAYIDGKYGAKVETNTVKYTGTTISSSVESGSIDSGSTNSGYNTSGSILVTATSIKGSSSRLQLSGVIDVQYQFYKDNISSVLNEENIINHILFIFDETNLRVSGKYTTIQYQRNDASQSVIVENLPASTDVVIPVTTRVTNLDAYLRDVKRD
jgi:hypothetical protein